MTNSVHDANDMDGQIDASDSRYGTVHLYEYLDTTSMCGRVSRTPSVHVTSVEALDMDSVCRNCWRVYTARHGSDDSENNDAGRTEEP